jgi:hypothetical protein
MRWVNEIVREAWRDHLLDPAPWYRRRSLWLMATALVVPFGWLLPVCRLAWVQARRADPRPLGDSAAPGPTPDSVTSR